MRCDAIYCYLDVVVCCVVLCWCYIYNYNLYAYTCFAYTHTHRHTAKLKSNMTNMHCSSTQEWIHVHMNERIITKEGRDINILSKLPIPSLQWDNTWFLLPLLPGKMGQSSLSLSSCQQLNLEKMCLPDNMSMKIVTPVLCIAQFQTCTNRRHDFSSNH